jgi:Zn-dependent protease
MNMHDFYIDRSEAIQIIISVVAISVAFSLVLGEVSLIVTSPMKFLAWVFFSLVTIGTGFIFHEMAHKLVAIHYGARARFVMWTQGLGIMLILALFGFLFAAPGAVYIYSNSITRKENGLISIAGPVTNIIMVIVFLLLAFILPIHAFGMNLWVFGAQLNLILAIFNMLPMFPLDGSKVFAWSQLAWLAFMGLCFAMGMVLLGMDVLIRYAILIIIAFVFSSALRMRF